MNKLTKKTSINRETFRNLSAGQLGVVAGGATHGKKCITTTCASVHASCPSADMCPTDAL